jgi:hypothetical protein
VIGGVRPQFWAALQAADEWGTAYISFRVNGSCKPSAAPRRSNSRSPAIYVRAKLCARRSLPLDCCEHKTSLQLALADFGPSLVEGDDNICAAHRAP